MKFSPEFVLTTPTLHFAQGEMADQEVLPLCASGTIRALGAVPEHVGPEIGN